MSEQKTFVTTPETNKILEAWQKHMAEDRGTTASIGDVVRLALTKLGMPPKRRS